MRKPQGLRAMLAMAACGAALLAAHPASAQTNEELLRRIDELQRRMAEMETALREATRAPRPPAAAPAAPAAPRAQRPAAPGAGRRAVLAPCRTNTSTKGSAT